VKTNTSGAMANARIKPRLSARTRLALLTTGLALLVCVFPQRISGAGEDDEGTTQAKFSPEAAATFNKRCTACHTFGKGIKVGPDLKGVAERRKHDWLLKFIHSSSTVIKSGDPIATSLFAQFKQQRMPDWTDLSEKQISDILEYLAIGGPDIKPADERSAELAQPADIERGRQLFYGQTHLRYGSAACSTCHSIAGAGLRGGSLGPDLTNSYLRYQDQALTSFLKHPCFQWDAKPAAPDEAHYLTPRESFSLKAFLRQAAVQRAATTQANRSELAKRPQNAGNSLASASSVGAKRSHGQ
jgi:mono/diheme cytochrome c family protein